MIVLTFEQQTQLVMLVKEYITNWGTIESEYKTIRDILIDFVNDLQTPHAKGWAEQIRNNDKNIIYEILIQCFGKFVKKRINWIKRSVKSYIARQYIHFAFGYRIERKKRFTHMMTDKNNMMNLLIDIEIYLKSINDLKSMKEVFNTNEAFNTNDYLS